MATAKGSEVRTVCGALMAAIGITLGISGAVADDLVGSEPMGASDADDATSMAAGGGRQLWSRQPGTSAFDSGHGVATDTNGNVYVVGETHHGRTAPHPFESPWVIKFDGDGHRLWSRQPGTSESEANGVATDRDGNVYVVGDTDSALGGPNKGDVDGWVIKFDGDGRRLWSRQPGTSAFDDANGVATDPDGNVYVVGDTSGALGGPNKGGIDAWVIKFDGDGHRLWSRQPGTSDGDGARGVATDRDGNVYVAGETDNALGGPNKGGIDAWVIKFDGDGRQLWSRQPGTSDLDEALSVATDRDGNVYVVGDTSGALGGPNKGDLDGWVIKFDGDGRQLWSRQPGTSAFDDANGVATDRDGNVYVVGDTFGALGGPNNGSEDAWVIKFDSDGHRLWSRQLGTSRSRKPGTSDLDEALGVATDRDSNVYVVGDTGGSLGGPNKGFQDAWLIKYEK